MLANKQFSRGMARGSFFSLQKQKLWKHYLQNCEAAAVFPRMGEGAGGAKHPTEILGGLQWLFLDPSMVLPNAQVISHFLTRGQSTVMGSWALWTHGSHVCAGTSRWWRGSCYDKEQSSVGSYPPTFMVWILLRVGGRFMFTVLYRAVLMEQVISKSLTADKREEQLSWRLTVAELSTSGHKITFYLYGKGFSKALGWVRKPSPIDF